MHRNHSIKIACEHCTQVIQNHCGHFRHSAGGVSFGSALGAERITAALGGMSLKEVDHAMERLAAAAIIR